MIFEKKLNELRFAMYYALERRNMALDVFLSNPTQNNKTLEYLTKQTFRNMNMDGDNPYFDRTDPVKEIARYDGLLNETSKILDIPKNEIIRRYIQKENAFLLGFMQYIKKLHGENNGK